MSYEFLNVARQARSGTRLSPENTFFLEDGSAVPARITDPRFVGVKLESPELLSWRGSRDGLGRNEMVSPILSFYCGLILTNEAKEVFERHKVGGMQFIPLSLDYDNKENAEDAWYGQVFNWKNPFDLSLCKFEYYDWPKNLYGTLPIQRAFGTRLIAGVESLAVDKGEIQDDVFLARFANDAVWTRVYFSSRFSQILRAELGVHVLEKFALRFDLDRAPSVSI